MTETTNKNKIRSKLTLKLPSSVNVDTIKAKHQDVRIGKSSVEVTIKGKKRDSQPPKQDNRSFNKKTFEAVLNSSSQEEYKEISSHDILLKSLKEAKKKEEERQKISEVESDLTKENLTIDSAKEISEKSDEKEIIIEEKLEEITEVVLEPKEEENNINLNSEKPLDSFDIRSKIKQSIENTNKIKEEREKILTDKREKEEKIKVEQQKALQERVKKSKATKFNADFEEEKKFNKSKLRENTYGKRKQTFIVSDDENEKYSKKRFKPKIKEDNSQKEYKKISREVDLPELITVSQLADRMSEKTGDVVKKLFSMGVVVTSNQAIDTDTAEIIVEEFGHIAKRVSHSDVENVLDIDGGNENFEEVSRAPVVTIMGHVDHGKTSLLDAMRQTNVVSGEHGGITQHIGASRIKTKSGKYITFLDTPGHEAFSEMRSRGANVTDIVILVVAADDGVKEQTIEAISHAKAAEVPIIVAINKIDKPQNDPSRVKNELLSYGIISEEMGGDAIFVEVSAKNKINLDKLEESILLQAEILELKSVAEGRSSGVVLESRVDPAKGVVATLLVQKGELNISDLIVVGTSYGKIRKMSDDQGKNVKKATPSMPVEILGLDNAPNAGDKFVEVSEERQAREIISFRSRKEREDKNLKDSAKSLGDIFKQSGKDKLKYLNIIIKGDVHGSVEAINGSVAKLNNEEVAVKVVHMATGAISESDVNLASASDALIIGFNVRANLQAKEMARSRAVDVRYYSIIYNLVDDLKLLLSGMLDPTKTEEYLGQAEIRQVFKVSGSGKIAGSFVLDGTIKRNAKARLLRDNIVIHDGILKTLKRFKDDVKEVKGGFECGIAFENFEDMKEKDIIECYEINETQRTF